MANEHMKRKIRIKNVMKYHRIPTRETKMIKTDNTKSFQPCARKWNSHKLLVEV